MMSGGVNNAEVLDELEGHLREDVARQERGGVEAEEAFRIAVERVGQPAALREEFAKAIPAGQVRLRRWKEAALQFLGVPRPIPTMLGEEAHETLELGRKEALGFHHDFIGTEHVLLGLMELKDGRVRRLLEKMGIDARVVRGEVERIVGVGPVAGRADGALPLTPRAKKALAIAATEARSVRRDTVAAEHIFVGLLLEGRGVAALVLKGRGVDLGRAREALARDPGGESGPA